MAPNTSFHLFPSVHYPKLYSNPTSPLWVDVTLFRLVSLVTVFFISYLLILPGFRGSQVSGTVGHICPVVYIVFGLEALHFRTMDNRIYRYIFNVL